MTLEPKGSQVCMGGPSGALAARLRVLWEGL